MPDDRAPIKIVEINHDLGSIITCEADGIDRAVAQLKGEKNGTF